MEERYKMALQAIVHAHSHGSGSGSWLQAACTMRDIAAEALNEEKGKTK